MWWQVEDEHCVVEGVDVVARLGLLARRESKVLGLVAYVRG
jgi:hypothetical protein